VSVMKYRIMNYAEVTGSSLWLILFPMWPLINEPVGLPVHILFFCHISSNICSHVACFVVFLRGVEINI